MTKTEYEKITNLLQLEKNFTQLLKVIENHKNDMILKVRPICKVDFTFHIEKDDMELIYQHYKNRLNGIRHELKELGYYD